MIERWNIVYEGKDYPCLITFKRMRNMTFRFDDGMVRVSCPYGIRKSIVETKIQEYFPRLLKRASLPSPIDGDSVYLFGEKKVIAGFSSLDEKGQEKFLKGIFLPYATDRVAFFSKQMGVDEPYKVRVRAMKTRLGVNSKKTHALTFALSLVHYAPDTIDSVVVHELAHHFVFDHSEKFYQVVYRYCPDYKARHAKLRKHLYE
jgi:predicted metal-dependent hydrolase